MVLTVAQRTAFFENADQLGIPHGTVEQMAIEGIVDESDLTDMDENAVKQMAENLRRPPGGGPAFAFGAKSHKRFLVACDLLKYYETVGRDVTAANIRWNHVMRNFDIQWKALKERSKNDETPDVPKISKALPIIKWTESFHDFLGQVIGVRTIPLTYVVRGQVEVAIPAPPLMTNQPHSLEHGSVELELVNRASHDHPLFRDDNSKLYYLLEEATRSTQYAASIKPFQRRKDGRGAWMALIGQYAGQDKWEAEIKKQEQLLHTRKWKGQSSYSLEQFVSSHRNAFVSMTACAEHVQYQLPNEHSRVGLLLDGIECSDAGLQAAMASVRTDDGPDGKRNDFEAAASHLLPYDPVAKRRLASKRSNPQISAVQEAEDSGESATVSSATTPRKKSIGKTGVHLRYHKYSEYKKLTDEQKAELHEWRSQLPDGKSKASKKRKHSDDSKSYSKKQVASMIKEKVDETVKELLEERQEESDTRQYVAAMIEAALQERSKTVAATDGSEPQTKPKTEFRLKSILKNARNAKHD